MDLISKYELIEKIVHTTDENLLHQIKHLLDEEAEESWNDLDPDLKASINRGLEQSDKKQGVAHEKVMADFRKKYRKK